MPLTTRYFSFDDVTPIRGWELLTWCRTHGASEFTLSALAAPTESDRMKAFFAQLDRHARPASPRRTLATGSLTPEVPLWHLSVETEALLRRNWTTGLVSREVDEDLWLEDLTVYRDGELMMGVVSHENGGALRVTELELRELRSQGFPDRDEIPWVAY